MKTNKEKLIFADAAEKGSYTCVWIKNDTNNWIPQLFTALMLTENDFDSISTLICSYQNKFTTILSKGKFVQCLSSNIVYYFQFEQVNSQTVQIKDFEDLPRFPGFATTNGIPLKITMEELHNTRTDEQLEALLQSHKAIKDLQFAYIEQLIDVEPKTLNREHYERLMRSNAMDSLPTDVKKLIHEYFTFFELFRIHEVKSLEIPEPTVLAPNEFFNKHYEIFGNEVRKYWEKHGSSAYQFVYAIRYCLSIPNLPVVLLVDAGAVVHPDYFNRINNDVSVGTMETLIKRFRSGMRRWRFRKYVFAASAAAHFLTLYRKIREQRRFEQNAAITIIQSAARMHITRKEFLRKLSFYRNKRLLR